MKTKTLVAVGCLFAVASAWLSACKPAPQGPILGIWGPTSYHRAPAEAGRPALPGIEQGTCAMAVWMLNGRTQEPAFVVWVGSGGGGSFKLREVPSRTPSAMGRDYEYEAAWGDVPVEFHTTDGQSSPLDIGGEKYDLAKGKLFLIAKRGDKVEVKQMPLAKLNLKPEGTLSPDQVDNNYLPKLAKTDPEIRAFWEAAAKAR